MYKPCSFNRNEYLDLREHFEHDDWTDAESELSEFNDDANALAVELAHTRYRLAAAEKLLEEAVEGMEIASRLLGLLEVDAPEDVADMDRFDEIMTKLEARDADSS